MNATIDLLLTRRSVPAALLAAPGPSADELQTLLTIASRVPDHGKLAPWRFIVLEGEARVEAGRQLARIAEQRQPDISETRLEDERQRFSKAPLVVAVVGRAAEHVKIPVIEQIYSAGAVCLNLEIAAHAMGYAACWLTDWPAYDAEARAALGLAEGETIAGFIHIGTPTIAPTDRPRPALADIVSRFGD
ncbi:nitroreductase family protein [Pleomorphomonas carboxyditropha]|uniref:Putative NAD(P)H nitroreductase n=1 Tax=Pleomorphomonas carboxyditropha TaxID=2023338 RepID=A0A2G9WQW1_9HYPH|nr:nitroreductase [Pleomorphomonas carboxyditropha]PIO97086.1 nitroreductase [Pleomorphomonas carboxyditropha]